MKDFPKVNLDKNKSLLWIVKSVIILLWFFTIINGYQSVKGAVYFKDDSVLFLSQLYQDGHILPFILLTPPFIAVFLNNKASWFLIQSYFYFLVLNNLFSVFYIDDHILLLFQLILLLIVLLLVSILNKDKIYSTIYKLSLESKLKFNMASSTIGILIVLAVAFIKSKK